MARESHAAWKPGKTRPDPVETVPPTKGGKRTSFVGEIGTDEAALAVRILG